MADNVGVAHRRQVRLAAEGGFVAFSNGRESAVRRLDPGDHVVCYVPRTDMEGAPVQAFVAHATVTEPYRRSFTGDYEPWVRDVRFDEVPEVPVRPLLDRLSFTRGRTSWGLAFHKGRFRLPPEDYAVLAAEFGLG